jgi:hypothetical protein
MPKIDAERAVRKSYLSDALRHDRNFAEHDTVEEWTDFVHDELDDTELLMM